MDNILNFIPLVDRIANLPFYTEGPAIDSNHNIFFTTLAGGTILKIDNKGVLHEWASSACPNGQIIISGDDHLICDSKLSAIRRFDRNGNFLKDEIRSHCADVPVQIPNDLVSDSYGNIYFTDSVRNEGKVFFLGINGEQSVIASGLDFPNGLAISPDQSFLYVAESYKNRILKISLSSDEMRDRISIFNLLPEHSSGNIVDNLPDGLALDNNGNLWVAHYGMQSVHKISTGGNLISSIDTNLFLTSNLLFIDEQTIIVTGGDGEPGPGAVVKIVL